MNPIHIPILSSLPMPTAYGGGKEAVQPVYPDIAAVLAPGPLPAMISIDRLSISFGCSADWSLAQRLEQGFAKELKAEGKSFYSPKDSHFCLRANQPFSEFRRGFNGPCQLRIDWNPSKEPLARVERLLACFGRAVKRCCVALDPDVAVTRIDVAIDYPCAVGAPYLLRPSAFRPAFARAPIVKGGYPICTVYFGSPRAPSFIRIYDKTAELEARGISPRRKAPELLPTDVYRFESVRRWRSARTALSVNPFEALPFPKIVLEDAATLPTPAEVYRDHFATLWRRFSVTLSASIQKAFGDECECSSTQGSLGLSLKRVRGGSRFVAEKRNRPR